MKYPVNILVDQISTNEKMSVSCKSDEDIERMFEFCEMSDDLIIIAMIDADEKLFSVNKK